jgi:hypothetical protein
MKFVIKENNNREIYKRAKKEFNSKNPLRHPSTQTYWERFGEANNMKVIIPSFNGQFPIVESLEFNTEADYAWFILRYS